MINKMSLAILALSVAIACTSAQAREQAAGPPAQVRPATEPRIEVQASDTVQLNQLLSGQKIDASFADTTSLKAKVIEVKEGMLTLEVESSQGPGALARGRQIIPAARFSTIAITKLKGRKRVIMGTVLGFAGLGLGVLAAATEFAGESFNRTNGGVIAATTTAGAVGGYYLGKRMDTKKVVIVIRP